MTDEVLGNDKANEVAALVVHLCRDEVFGIIAEDLMIPVESYSSATPEKRWDAPKL